jgi:hypothetical protein
MMNPKDAMALLTTLALGEKKNGRLLNYNPSAAWTYCPCCGTGRMTGSTFKFAVIDARDPVTEAEGLVMVFYVDHPLQPGDVQPQRCLIVQAGVPLHGGEAEALLSYGQALQVLAFESLMAGGKVAGLRST